MRFIPNERTALFIDGTDLYHASRNLGFEVDYKRLLEFFRKKAPAMLRGYYYAAIIDTEDRHTPIKPLVDWLVYNGYTVITKPAKEFTDSDGRRHVRGNISVEMALGVLDLVPHIDHAVLFSGNSDFSCLVDAVKRRGVRVSVVSSIRTGPSHYAADELRRQADQFIELAEIASEIARQKP